jgi:hypothetical protein
VFELWEKMQAHSLVLLQLAAFLLIYHQTLLSGCRLTGCLGAGRF